MTPQGAKIKAGKMLSQFIRAIADEIYESDEENPNAPMTKAEALARDIWEKALAGDKKCRDIVLERIEGKVGTSTPKNPNPGFSPNDEVSVDGKSAINDLMGEDG